MVVVLVVVMFVVVVMPVGVATHPTPIATD